MKLTREKRPDKVTCRWKDYEVELSEDNKVFLYDGCGYNLFPKSEIYNLIKALIEVSK